MGFLSDLFRTAIRWAFFFALIGGLGEATVTLCKEAGAARAYGLVKLTRLNRSLVGDVGLPRSFEKTHHNSSETSP